MKWQYSFSGKTTEAQQAIAVQVTDPAGVAILSAVIGGAGTDNVSISGTASETSISMSGSFFNDPKPAPKG